MFVSKLLVWMSWLVFCCLFLLSINELIEDKTMTTEVWSYLLLMPLALAFALSSRPFWLQKNMAYNISSDEDEAIREGNKEAPDPENSGFDIPIM
jgi:hypothetical protein